MATVLFLLLLIVVVGGGVFISPVAPKATIEPCLSSVTCTSLLGYTLYTDLKLSEISNLFQTDTISILAANSITPTFSDQILPSGLFLKIPTVCSCSNGIRQSTTTYKTRPSDTLTSIAQTIYGGLVSSDQIREANGIVDPSLVDARVSLKVPLPCTCFNGSDNGLPAVYLAYVVRARDTVGGIAKKYFTTVTDLMNANSLGSPVVDAGDILAVPLLACGSRFPQFSSDYGLTVPNGSYAITAGRCIQCSCGPDDTNLFCTPTSLSASCSTMQCKDSSLMVGNVTIQQKAGGCSVTSCSYGGLVNGTIVAKLTTSLQPRCPGQRRVPSLVPPPTVVVSDDFISVAPASSPMSPQPGGVTTVPKSSSVPASILPSSSTATTAENGAVSGAPSLDFSGLMYNNYYVPLMAILVLRLGVDF